MKVKVKYFGAIAEQTGVNEETLDLTQIGTELEKLKEFCINKYGLSDDDSLQMAINQQLSQKGDLQAGDEIAFLPPFAGG